ncbi:subtilisin-like protease [Phtheirospermum japonicum]|uniref:Subtilisin-like protease n=1 Tax=Phtheirospermum japonicum TaxID=374723 RepID=A0A830CKJ9_9LAMI|nr:subtilisin-like protease [Phtheirospermum japonicum]
MAPMFLLLLLSIIPLPMLTFRPALANNNNNSDLQTYIVHVSLPDIPLSLGSKDLLGYYHSFLPQNSDRIVHTYRSVINGFAAKLTPHELEEMSTKAGFLYARPDKKYILHTTYSPAFLGLYPNQGPWSSPTNFGKGIIIGVFDGGITPGHPSFNDQGVPPPPPDWKGKCELNSCNNKIIGARNLIDQESGPPIDKDGHGTHTASTAAGNFVEGANLFGQANGTASGVAPLAHLSIYRVCSDVYCEGAALLAGIDAAIDDGVHVISISIGDINSVPFYQDSIAIGSFAAMQKGIFVSCSAGNSGPGPYSLSNEAPWILTVGASTTDRRIVGVVKLGNGDEIDGESLGHPSFPNTSLPLVNGNEAKNVNRSEGKIVLFETGESYPLAIEQVFKEEGVAGMVLMNNEIEAYDTVVYPKAPLPTILVSNFAGEKIKAYINSTIEPFVTISFKGTIVGADKTVPAVSVFSSRGPNLASPGILKPDIIGPGADILAAWHEPVDKSIRKSEEALYYNIISGTSMSCPHLSGVAALVKTVHPDWSPAMIKSAIMTTATQVNLNKDTIVDQRHIPANIFAIGAGHVNPSLALDPGLVYDIQSRDYISYLCSLYDEKQVEVIIREKIDCDGPEYGESQLSEAQLNYPSLAVELGNATLTYSRTVTNVGGAKSTYNVEIESVAGVNMIVEPTVLVFGEVNEKITYNVQFRRQDYDFMMSTNVSDYYVQGSIAWVSADHKVRIPVSVHIVMYDCKN